MFNTIGIEPDKKIYEAIMYLISAAFVVSMVIWMWRTSKNLKNEMVQKLERIVVSEGNSSKGLGLLVFTFFMVFREGIETVLFIAALGKGNSPATSLIGAVIGLVIATGIGVLMVYGSVKIDIRLFFKVTGIALMLLTVKLLAGGVLEFGDAGLISLGSEIDRVLAFIAEGGSSQIISIVLVTLPLVTFFYSMLKDSWKHGNISNT
ncbi:MAG: FTR1 family protein [Eubacteriales bacterium]